MELSLKIALDEYEVKEYPETGTMLIVRKGMSGEPDYSVEGEGFVIEFKEGKIYLIDIFDPEVARQVKEKFSIIYT